MTSGFKKAMLYLGLGPDEEYDDHDAYGDADELDEARPAATAPRERAVPEPAPEPRRGSTVRAIPSGSPTLSAVRPQPAPVRPAAAGPASSGGGVIRTLPSPVSAKPSVVLPASFNDAQVVADHFKNRQPVIMNLQNADRDLSRRLIDFTSGLFSGIGGQMERVADKVYLLTPVDVEVSAEERRRLRDDLDDV